MDGTPERPSRSDAVPFAIAADQTSSPRRSTRIKKPPPITPRRFNRFFTPRYTNGPRLARGSRKALRDISKAALNTRQNDPNTPRPTKKRKLSFQSPSSSLPSSPVRRVGFLTSSQEPPPEEQENDQTAIKDDDVDSEASTDVDEIGGRHSKIRPYRTKGVSASVLDSRLGARPSAARTSGKGLWHHETANFYSSATDINVDYGPPLASQQGRPQLLSLPFCATSCNTNPLIAVGDEEGHVRLIDSANECATAFAQSFLIMKPHDNAIMDLEFSEDDSLLATASGDQTCHIIDVKSQKSVWTLVGHTSSVKKVQFQPGNLHMLSTCARDGTIAIWDTRENHTDRPSHTVQTSIASDIKGVQPSCIMYDAHLGRLRTRPTAYTGRSDFSVTSLSFISPSRPHLFATASESDSVVKLWDMRSTHRFRRKTVPVSCTGEPKSHEIHRRFGITSLAMSTDHGKLYTLCRDHTIYAYSTAHLILGSAPEFSSTSKPFEPTKRQPDSKSGLGPLYGFRHPALQVSTFYPKLAVRKATDSLPELIAVGSSDDCAVLFPTSPRYLTPWARRMPLPPSEPQRTRPRFARVDSQSASLSFIHRRFMDHRDIPIYYHGTPLVRGHTKEVTAVAWSSEGNLVTISDDFSTRCWREDGERARVLRNPEEGEAERWGCGWADVRGGWDEEE